MNVTTITVTRKRSIQPEKYGNTAAELEVTANLNDDEDWQEAARALLVSTRALVYENLNLKLPATVAGDTKVDTPVETATVKTTEDKPKPRRGRPRKDTTKDDFDLPGVVDDATESEPVEDATPSGDAEVTTNDDETIMTQGELQGWLVEQIKAKKIDIGAARKILVEVAGVVKSNDVPDDKLAGVIAAFKKEIS